MEKTKTPKTTDSELIVLDLARYGKLQNVGAMRALKKLRIKRKKELEVES